MSDQSNTNPFIDPTNADNTAADIAMGLALIRYVAFLETCNDHSISDSRDQLSGQMRVLEALEQAVFYLARMQASELDGPLPEAELKGVVND